MRISLFHLVLALVVALLIPSQCFSTEATDSGVLEVAFVYMPPGEVYPTYDTAIWLEDESGNLVQTLFVSQVLSDTEYQSDDICPDWTKKANWGDADRPVVDAVTRPTPLIGGESQVFDLGTLGVAPGTYQFRFEVHVVDEFNILFRGELSVGESASEVNLESAYVPTQPENDQTVVEAIRVSYYPKEKP